MLVTATFPIARSFDVTVSVQVAPSVAPVVGKRGKKLRNEEMTCASVGAGAVVSDATEFRNSPLGVSRPVMDSPFTPVRLIPGGSVEPESGTIESTVIVVAYRGLSAGREMAT